MYMNPMAGVVTVMRAELIHQGTSLGRSRDFLRGGYRCRLLGTRYFVRAERRFADIA